MSTIAVRWLGVGPDEAVTAQQATCGTPGCRLVQVWHRVNGTHKRVWGSHVTIAITDQFDERGNYRLVLDHEHGPQHVEAVLTAARVEFGQRVHNARQSTEGNLLFTLTSHPDGMPHDPGYWYARLRPLAGGDVVVYGEQAWQLDAAADRWAPVTLPGDDRTAEVPEHLRRFVL